MTVKPAVVDTTIALQDDTEQLHSDVKRLMQELFPEQWGSLETDRMQVPVGRLSAVSKRSIISHSDDPQPAGWLTPVPETCETSASTAHLVAQQGLPLLTSA